MKLRVKSAPIGSECSATYRNAGLSVADGSDTCYLILYEDYSLVVVIENRVLSM